MPNASMAPTHPTAKGSMPDTSTGAAAEGRGAALDFLRLLATEVSKGTVDLPCFPDVVIRIRDALADPNTTIDRTVWIVGNEPRLAARLLQTANSAAFNLSGKPLTDLRSAITRLGQQLVQSAAMAFAIQQMKSAESLRSIAKPLSELWRECISVASVSRAMARHTKVSPDEAFLTGLLHGIGRLYIMVRAVGQTARFANNQTLIDLVADWHAPIGKAVLESWGFAEKMCTAVGDQDDHERRWIHDSELSDILVASVALADALRSGAPLAMDAISAFQHIGLTEENCAVILTQAKQHLGSLQDALGG
jgi:HD-like signal output (HDOD) protein